jgi:tRNA pseudouridine55 synthase
MKSNYNFSGVINIYKEKGFTSHDVVNIVRNTLSKVKTGHTGTLDPEAEGVLPVCVGKATKLADYIAADIKEYIAEITLGISTTTEDIFGDVLEEKPVNVTEEGFKNAAVNFIGEYHQKPPMYSAIKVNGRKLYELAREGKEVERKTRLIHIFDISDIKSLGNNKFAFKVLCSKGTYIRTLCKDIGEKLGCGGCMSSLIRSRSGNFYLENSIKIDGFKKLVGDGNINDVLIPMDVILKDFNTITVTKEAEKFVVNGNPISKNFLSTKEMDKGGQVVLKDWDNNIVGIYTVEEEFIKPKTMLK